MVESWRSTFDQKEIIGAVFVDLSKTFDIIDHNVLIAKVNAYGASVDSLKFTFSYLKNRKQRTAIENSYSPWKEIKALAPQGSILDPLFLNIFIDYLFCFFQKCWNRTNYADDYTLYTTGDCFEVSIEKLSADLIFFQSWFHENYMILNPKNVILSS